MSRKGLVLLALLVSATAFVLPAGAQPGAHVGGTATARLRGFDEVPAISSSGGGRFNATINEEGTAIDWELTYFSLAGHVTQSHLHFAQRGVNGGIMVFLCSNLPNPPAGTQACPDPPASLNGTITFENVGSGANGQGIGPFEFPALLRAIRAGIVYANVHSDLFPGGEIRGQLSFTPSD